MKHLSKYIGLFAAVILIGCTADDMVTPNATPADPQELTTIQAIIGNHDATTRGTVTPLADYVGRSVFKHHDRIMFTQIRRTNDAYPEYTYPGPDYEGIAFDAGEELGWDRTIIDATKEPERVYWTDAQNVHTFIAYSKPQEYAGGWKIYESADKNYYIGALGNPLQADDPATEDVNESTFIDYTLTAAEQTTHSATVNNKLRYYNPKLEQEDVLIAYDTQTKAEPGGSVALIKFHHALSSVRVVVNINGFSSSSTAADNATTVSDLYLLHQPTMYVWMQSDAKAQPLRADRDGAQVTDQEMVNAAWDDDDDSTPVTAPDFNQRKHLKLWCPQPDGVGENQSKTFTFYGITTPQPLDYITTLAGSERNTEVSFKVTYPNPLNPKNSTLERTYTASLANVNFEAGYNTTINISLNHENEKITIGAEYENWEFIATPDQGNLHKHATFLQDIDRTKYNVTISKESAATEDDATWLYQSGDDVLDIYGNDGSATKPYQISTAFQLLSFAHEVKGGMTFEDKFVRLDADLTLQKTSDLTKYEIVVTDDTREAFNSAKADSIIIWPGIGDDGHPFNGTFLGGNRYINRLYGSPLFASLGAKAKIEQLNVNAMVIGNTETGTPSAAVSGDGLFANTNEGLICACRVDGDVSLSGATAGAFVGTNSGKIFASYHIGNTKGTTHVGGLVGSNIGIISSCYQAGTVTGTSPGGITSTNSGGTLYNNFFLAAEDDSTLPGATGKPARWMTKQDFVTTLNTGIGNWEIEHDNHQYVYQPASYPKLE